MVDLRELKFRNQQDREQLLRDIEEREQAIANDPIGAHEAVMERTELTREAPELVFKTHTTVHSEVVRDAIDDDQLGGFMDAVVNLLIEQREKIVNEEIAPLRERLANCEGQLSAVMALLNGGQAAPRRLPRPKE